MKSRGRRAIPIALRPLVFMKLADALHLRTSPAGRGLGAVDNATSIYKAAATEVRCGVELSPCSVACPSGTFYTSLWPHLCIELRDGTSVGWPLDRVWICISDDACCQPPFEGGLWLSSNLRRHRSTMVVFCFHWIQQFRR